MTMDTTIDINGHVAMYSDSGATLSGEHATRLFTIGTGATLDAENIVVTKGHDANIGRGFYVDHGILNLANCGLTYNSVGAPGRKDINGGGVCNHYGTVRMHKVTATNNFCAY